jgi:hypothetical protein
MHPAGTSPVVDQICKYEKNQINQFSSLDCLISTVFITGIRHELHFLGMEKD